MRTAIIADYIVTDPGVVKENLFETAAWYEKVRLEPGVYPIEAAVREDGRAVGKHVHSLTCFEVPGTVVSDYFQALWCGSPVGEPYDSSKNVGKPAFWQRSVHLHSLARVVVEGEDSPFRLRPGFEARRRPLAADDAGKTYDIYEIFEVTEES